MNARPVITNTARLKWRADGSLAKTLLNTKFRVKIKIWKPEEEESLLLSENIMTWPSSLI